MNIERWDAHAASDDELQALYEFGRALAVELDPQTPPEPFALWRQELLQRATFHETQRWVAHDGDDLVAYGQLSLDRTGDNAHRAEFDVHVAASHRRRGIGRSVLVPIVDAAAADGRSTLAAGTPQGTVGEEFLAAVRTERVYLERRSRLVVADIDRQLVDGWIADAKSKASDYSLLRLDGAIPDEHLQAVIDVHATMNDAPREGLDLEDEHDTPETFREREALLFALGTCKMQVIARHDPSGEFAGFTTLSWHPLLPEVVWQWGTAVRREHRGHAIGRFLKAANLNNLRDENPAAEFIDTWNAGSNKWMLAINDDLGFRPYLWYQAFQGHIDDVRQALEDQS
jgi:GNAT superfamily N-acetyltransferase